MDYVLLPQIQLCTGFSDVIRNNCLPTPMMITALSLYCMQHTNAIGNQNLHTHFCLFEYFKSNPSANRLTGKDETKMISTDNSEIALSTRRRRSSWEPLELSNKKYDELLRQRGKQPDKNFIKNNIVSKDFIEWRISIII